MFKAALDVLQKGGVILYPTDTIWGIGCDACNEDAVKRVYEIKNRIDSKSMLVLMENAALLERYVAEVPEIAYDLIELTDKAPDHYLRWCPCFGKKPDC